MLECVIENTSSEDILEISNSWSEETAAFNDLSLATFSDFFNMPAFDLTTYSEDIKPTLDLKAF